MFPYRDVWVLASTLISVASAAQWASRADISDSQPPAPIVVEPSQYWDGVDGLWSSFGIRVGTPSQNVRVLVSTNSPATMVVLPDGCTKPAMNPVADNCAFVRGNLFNISQSPTWINQGNWGINQDGLGFEANLGYSVKAYYGHDKLGLGFAGGASEISLENQTIAGIGTVAPFYTGFLGLNTQPVNYSHIGNFSGPSLFTSLKTQKLIPSLSWSYTAGAKYRLKSGGQAQLIFGGYDTSRFTQNPASFTLDNDISRDIVVGIQSISYSGTTQANLLPTPKYAFIESTDPNIWLPKDACEEFERAFGISIDKNSSLYLINSTQYTKLQATNPEITFTLGNGLTGGETVNVVLPFKALALPTKYPFTRNSTFHFPLKTAANDSQITLGRAFLQEAYLTVDYERGNFSVSQCVWEDGAPATVQSIISPLNEATSSPSPTSSAISKAATASKKLSGGAIAGIAIGAVALVGALVGLVYFFFVYRRKRANTINEVQPTNPTSWPKDHSYFGAAPGNTTDPALKLYGDLSDAYKGRAYAHEVQGSEPFSPDEVHQLQGDDARSYSEAASMVGVVGLGSHPFAHELEGTRLERPEMDDSSSRAGLSPISRTQSQAGGLSRDSSGRYRTGSPPISSPGSPLSSVR